MKQSRKGFRDHKGLYGKTAVITKISKIEKLTFPCDDARLRYTHVSE